MSRDKDSLEQDLVAERTENSLIASLQHEDVNQSTDEEVFGRIDYLKKWLPQTDPDHTTSWIARLLDRDVSLLLILGLSFVILALNLAVTIWAAVKHGAKNNISDILGADNGYDCDMVKTWNKWLHFAINTLSTLLLGASNYCAQLLVAPTREKVDEAHKSGKWLDIGVQSIRNLRHAPFPQKCLWFCLMISSGLLHLFWNSAVFATTPISPYSIGYVTADFMEDQQPWNNVASPDLSYIRQNALSLPSMNKSECIATYAGRLAGLSSLLLVSANVTMDQQRSYDQTNARSSFLFSRTTVSRAIHWRLVSAWMCNKRHEANRVSCTTETMKSPYGDTWTVALWGPYSALSSDLSMDPNDDIWSKVDYCMPRDELRYMGDKCVLRISKVVLSIVTAMNLVKCICIALTIRLHNRIHISRKSTSGASKNQGFAMQTMRRAFEVMYAPMKTSTLHRPAYLVTLGDAMASFLKNPDPHTQSCGFASRRDFERNSWPKNVPGSWRESVHWFHAASARRWALTLSSMIIAIGASGGLLYMTIKSQQAQGVKTDIISLGSYGLGTPQQFATALTSVTDRLGPSGGFFFAVFFANIFQVLVSALYLLCNNLLTVMLVGSEWNAFITKRKTLRVSIPKGIQRSSFFLSLPYRYSVTLMVLSGLIHFFVSQSVFVVQTVAYRPRYEPQRFVRDHSFDASCIVFSSLGVILSIATALVLVFYILLVGLKFKYKTPIGEDADEDRPYPVLLVSTCSAAISANCHKHPEDTDCIYLPLKWGFVRDANSHGGRYTFSTSSDVRSHS